MNADGSPRPVRVAAVGDLHCTTASRGALSPWLRRIHEHADVLLLCGDLTDFGGRDQARVLAEELRVAELPMLAVLGNHDYMSGDPEAVIDTLQGVGVRVLHGGSVELLGVGFVGTKGFVGGFGAHALHARREPGIEDMLRETLDEAARLDAGLARLQTPQRVAMLHYAPVRGTIANEPAETHAFFGSSLLEAPLVRHGVRAVFHGHAHRGPLEAAISNGAPVYNVAAPLLRRTSDGPPYRIVTIEA